MGSRGMTWGTVLDQYKYMHAQGLFPGYSMERHVDAIARMVKDSGAKTLLDYGCGKGLQYLEKDLHYAWGGMLPSLYDPGVPAFAEKPSGRFDGVICTDVLEHIPEGDLPYLIDDVISYADKWVFFSICTRKAKKTLPDGRNCHLTVKPKGWWQSRMPGGDDVPLIEIAWHDD